MSEMTGYECTKCKCWMFLGETSKLTDKRHRFCSGTFELIDVTLEENWLECTGCKHLMLAKPTSRGLYHHCGGYFTARSTPKPTISSGAHCSKCNDFNEYAELPYKCWRCRQ